LSADEEFVENPVVNLLNALKVSGRTKNGLGVGFLNAITDDLRMQKSKIQLLVLRKEKINRTVSQL
jgi:hypothetical protein